MRAEAKKSSHSLHSTNKNSVVNIGGHLVSSRTFRQKQECRLSRGTAAAAGRLKDAANLKTHQASRSLPVSLRTFPSRCILEKTVKIKRKCFKQALKTVWIYFFLCVFWCIRQNTVVQSSRTLCRIIQSLFKCKKYVTHHNVTLK